MIREEPGVDSALRTARLDAAAVPDVRVQSMAGCPQPSYGLRVLVERRLPLAWARGAARPDVWAAALAPSARLRRRYPPTGDAFGEFALRYAQELDEPVRRAQFGLLRDLAADGPIVLLVSTSPARFSHAAVLARRLRPAVAGPIGLEGGDPACWLDRICPECGRIPDASTAAGCWSCRAVATG